MQPTELTLPGVLIFSLIALVVFAFRNPRGYKKIQNCFIYILVLAYGGIIGVLVYKAYLLSKLKGEVINDSTIDFLFSYAGDFAFYSACAFILFFGILILERVHTLNDKNRKS